MSTYCVIALGSNLADDEQEGPISNLQQAFKALGEAPFELLKQSGIYLSEPFGPKDQPDFYNAVALVSCDLSPQQLLHALKSLERQLGRVTSYRWGPRAIDLDIIFYGATSLESDELCIPHKLCQQRNFVIEPIKEIFNDIAKRDSDLAALAKEKILAHEAYCRLHEHDIGFIQKI